MATNPPTPPPKKKDTNLIENSLRKVFAQTLSACLLFNLKERGEDSLHDKLRKSFTQTLFIGVVGFGGGFPSLEVNPAILPNSFLWQGQFVASLEVEGFMRIPVIQERPFVHNSVCSQFLEGLFAILAECSQFCLRSF